MYSISRVREVRELQQSCSTKRGLNAEQLLSLPAMNHKRVKADVEAGASSSSSTITSEVYYFLESFYFL